MKDAEYGERYARDKTGQEVYPRRDKNVFAKNRQNVVYYARNNRGDEYYPRSKKGSLVYQDESGRYKIARSVDGTELYPHDVNLNEYYLCEGGKPFLLHRGDGRTYLAKNRNGMSLVPWNFLPEYAHDNSPFFYCRDNAGNSVYINGSQLSSRLRVVCDCICRMAITFPSLFPCTTSVVESENRQRV